MNFAVKSDANDPSKHLVYVDQINVGIVSYHKLSKTGWYEDEDRGHFTLMFDIEYDDLINCIRKYYG